MIAEGRISRWKAQEQERPPYNHMLDLAKEAEPPAEGKASKIIFEDDRIKSVVYGFRPDQGLSATHLTLSNLRSVKK